MFYRTINGRSYFANGEICEAERPEIVATTDRKLRLSNARFAVMFPG